MVLVPAGMGMAASAAKGSSTIVSRECACAPSRRAYATVEGQYTICFSLADDEEHKFGSLSVSAQFTVGDPPDLIQLAKTEHLSPIEERVKNLHESMNAVRDLQDEIRDQDEAQSKMTRSTRSWLLYFTLIEATVLVGVTVWQNLYLKSFFEVKRVV